MTVAPGVSSRAGTNIPGNSDRLDVKGGKIPAVEQVWIDAALQVGLPGAAVFVVDEEHNWIW